MAGIPNYDNQISSSMDYGLSHSDHIHGVFVKQHYMGAICKNNLKYQGSFIIFLYILTIKHLLFIVTLV